MNEDIFSELVKAWSSPIVARDQVDRFSGGMLHRRTLANLDSLGKGPEGKISIGRKVAYPAESLASWMRRRADQTSTTA